jgi:PD-(D/E)XK nuclease superfamily
MGNQLSYSRTRLYQECGQKYKYSYIDKLREKTKSGALFFGTAIDKAIEEMINDPRCNDHIVFDEAFTNSDINGKKIYIPESTKVVYSASDFDSDLLTDEDWIFLQAKQKELLPELVAEGLDPIGCVQECAMFKKQRAFRNFRENENRYLNLANWLSMRRKGHIILSACREKILPQITKVVGTQVKVELDNGEDTLLGFADLVCYWNSDTEPTVWDFKTSSIDYEEDSVKTSSQLSIYANSLGINKAGYIVFKKGIHKNKTKTCNTCGFDGSGSRAKTCTDDSSGKRCNGEWRETIRPEAVIQIIQDIIPQRMSDIVMDNVDNINRAIKAGIFVRNFDSCVRPYGRCAYYNACHTGDESDLEKL